MLVNLPMKIIAALLIISAGVSTVYSAQITTQYSAAMNALGEFSADAEYNISSIESGKLSVTITFHNPSDIPISTYEVDYAFYIMNSTTGNFKRYAVASGTLMITIEPNSDKKIKLAISVVDTDGALWSIQHDEHPVIHQYMEVYYQVSNFEYKNRYTWGIPHVKCGGCGGGPFG